MLGGCGGGGAGGEGFKPDTILEFPSADTHFLSSERQGILVSSASKGRHRDCTTDCARLELSF